MTQHGGRRYSPFRGIRGSLASAQQYLLLPIHSDTWLAIRAGA
jgi:hypothetical protein